MTDNYIFKVKDNGLTIVTNYNHDNSGMTEPLRGFIRKFYLWELTHTCLVQDIIKEVNDCLPWIARPIDFRLRLKWDELSSVLHWRLFDRPDCGCLTVFYHYSIVESSVWEYTVKRRRRRATLEGHNSFAVV